ncbi:MAG: propionate catabolism operon regulatory protein PrpR [Firmicutes bacterium HGW-Firmicutes-5]|nr:MAG: propionate catabolism operon regulatory protein PrpR [Firmicutes bacterium HGW-Firmicutes-5]
MSGKIKALGIAPYEGMKSMMLKLATERDDIDLTVYVGDLNKGAEIAKRNFPNDFDVIISRGGTAEMIGAMTDIPLIEIQLSVYDILRAIKLAENYSDRYAVVGFSAITGSAQLLCDLLQYDLDIFTIHNMDEVQHTLLDLKNRGYRMVLCDMITNTTAKRLGLNAILITSGNESISSAFDQAVKLCKSYANIKDDKHFLEEIIRGQNHTIMVYNSEGNLVYTTFETEDQTLTETIKKEIPETFESGSHKFFKNIQDRLYSITSKVITTTRGPYAVFYFTSDYAPMARSNNGIHFSNKRDVEDHFFNSFCSVTNSMDDIKKILEFMNHGNFPIMVIGDIGSGKEQLVGTLFAQSNLSNNPLITIDCSSINDKRWGFITNHFNSPLNDNGNTLFFKNINSLTQIKQKQLLSIINETKLHKRNQVIFSCISKENEGPEVIVSDLINQLSCMTIYMPSLSERKDDIPTLSSLYLGTLNIHLAKQIIGFEPEALTLLKNYDWPHNYTQFKRILNELAVITSTPYIRTTDVASVLRKEKIANIHLSGEITKSVPSGIDLSQSLHEINQEIVQIVLRESDGNQSKAAKRLAISRTTLWRYLKEN